MMKNWMILEFGALGDLLVRPDRIEFVGLWLVRDEVVGKFIEAAMALGGTVTDGAYSFETPEAMDGFREKVLTINQEESFVLDTSFLDVLEELAITVVDPLRSRIHELVSKAREEQDAS